MTKTIRNKKNNKTKTMKKLVKYNKLFELLKKDTSVGFEPELEKTKEYKNQLFLENVQKKLIDRFKTPFTPSKIKAKDDFYTYINYRWLKDTSRQKENAPEREKYFVQVDDFRILQNQVYYELIDIVKDYIKNNHSEKATCIKNIYTSLHNLDQTSTKKHIQIVKQRYEEYTAKDDLLDYLAHINSNEIVSWASPISWSMQADEKNSGIFENVIGFPELSIYDYLVYLDPLPTDLEQDVKYRRLLKNKFLQYINDIFEGCFGKNHDLNAMDVFEVERDIMNALGCNSIKKDSDNFYNVVTAKESLEKYGFDWERFSLKLGYEKPPEFFICYSLNYLKCISTLLKDNWKTPKWKSYWFYLYLKQIIRFDSKLRYIYYDFNEKFLKGQQSIFPKEIYPIFGLSLTFNTFLTEEYVKRNDNPIYTDYARNMGNDLISVFKRIIKRNKWLTPKTKKYALLKLNHLDLIIAKPEKLREDPLLKYSSNDAWMNMLLLCSWKKNQYIALRGKKVIDIPVFDWSQFKLTGKQAYIVNAFYTPSENSIYIPLAYLRNPFIDLSEKGIEYNLAYLGQTLAHEMSHSLDENGSKYDYKGNLYNWWTPQDKKKYKEIINDIIYQYEVFAGYDNIKFDAAIGVGEDMADISGMAICVEYLRDFHMKNNDIVPISSLSFQKFFTYIAIQNRQHVYKNAIKAQLKTNPHPMDKYRTNVPLSRLELFRSLYNVNKGDKMWWHSTNTIWN